MTKAQLVKALAWEHPMATLEIGTLAANVKNALKVNDISRDPIGLAEDNAVAKEMIDCVRAIVKEANRVKRRCQGLFGAYFERIDRDGATSDDKEFLKEICPPIPRELTIKAAPNTPPSQNSTTLENDDDTSDRQVQFIGCFMRYLYSNNFPRNTGIGVLVNRFIMRLEQLGLHKPVRVRSSLEEKSEFSSNELVRSASAQLAAEMKKIYWHGSVELLEQLRIQFADENKNANAREDVAASKDADIVGSSSDAKQAAVAADTASSKDKDIIATKAKDGNNTQSGGFPIAICSNLSAVENFLKFNKLVK
ncbi:hypothetical protein BGZ91_009550, partial [Linnemannia elongata]